VAGLLALTCLLLGAVRPPAAPVPEPTAEPAAAEADQVEAGAEPGPARP
jgi:hypothetical protein